MVYWDKFTPSIRIAMKALDMKPTDYESRRLISRVAFQIYKAKGNPTSRLISDHISICVNNWED